MNLRRCLGFLILIAIVKSYSINLDVKQNLCGRRLQDAMTVYCESYYTNDDSTPNPLEVRGEDQIVTFCCHRACSIRRLLEEFCKKVKEEYREAFETKPTSPPPLPIPQKLQDLTKKTNAIVAQTSDERQDAATIPMAPSQKSKAANAIWKRMENLKITQRPYPKGIIGYTTSNQQKPILIDKAHSEMAPLYHSVENVEMDSLQRYYSSE